LVALAAAAGVAALEAAEEAGAEVEDEEEADLTIVFGYTHMSKVFLS
jgi:hypothetical protein